MTFSACVNTELSTIVWLTVLDAANNLSHRHPIDYRLVTPLSAEYLEEGLFQSGESCEGSEIGGM